MKKHVILMFCAMLALTLFLTPAALGEDSGLPFQKIASFGLTKGPRSLFTPTPKVGIILDIIQQETPKPTAVATLAPSKTVKPEKTRKPTPHPTPDPEVTQEGGPVFTSFGLYWQEMLPKITEEWYMFTPST